MKHETNSVSGVPFYKIGTFGGVADSFISLELYEQYKNKYPYPQKGQVLISAAGTLGKVVIFDGKPSYFQDSNIVWIDANEKIINNTFLYYVLKNINWKKYATE
ncbi:restriction endonuclease subunit S, partial [Haemophilus influenzae]